MIFQGYCQHTVYWVLFARVWTCLLLRNLVLDDWESVGGGMHTCIGATCDSAPVILDNALMSVYTYYALAIYYIYYNYIYIYILYCQHRHTIVSCLMHVWDVLYIAHTYQLISTRWGMWGMQRNLWRSLSRQRSNKHRHTTNPARNVPVIVVRKTFTASALYVEFSSDSLPCKMVVRLLLLLCLAFLRITAGEILLYCIGLSLVQVPHLVCRHNSAV